ncbi:MAG: glycosyl transferase family protein [Bryobacteraceae bacterium]
MAYFSHLLPGLISPTAGGGATSILPALLGLLAALLLVTGIDDCIPVLFCLAHRLSGAKSGQAAGNEDADPSERRIAIFVPCWMEYGVIANMVRHNLSVIKYRNYDIFLGVYPNDDKTFAVAEDLTRSYRNVHLAVCARPGPTSKADCLNNIFRKMVEFEGERGCHFDTVVLHDAEDLVHPDALATINHERKRHAMVQIPVLPLPTPFTAFTHAIYCDEFAEFQTIDMRARGFSRSFIPSNGVGTGFARCILERLGEERGIIFDPVSLTEDYEIGVYIHRIGYPQIFVPLRHTGRDTVATREYFPRRMGSAIRQRSRWVTGIVLQGWERDGWRGSLPVKYWFWRDRKGIVANPLGLLTNIIFLYGIVDLAQSAAAHRAWAFATSNPAIVRLCFLTFILQCFRLALRMACVGRIYGVPFALGVPLRSLHGNLINCFASFRAVYTYVNAKRNRRHLAWLKTDHAYPTRSSLPTQRRELPDVIVSSGLVAEEQLAAVHSQVSAQHELEDFLLAHQIVSEDELCQALSVQSGLPVTRVDLRALNHRVVQSLPARAQKDFNVIPYRIEKGQLLVAGSRVPSPEVLDELRKFTQLPIEFRLVSRRHFDEIKAALQPRDVMALLVAD